MVKKEVRESELLFLAKRTKRDSNTAKLCGENEVNVAVLVKKEVRESELLFLALA